MSNKTAILIALGFFVFWMLVLYAGADHPPPAGFLWMFPLVGACAFVVYRRVPIYAYWSEIMRPGRLAQVILEGAVAGLVVALLAWYLLPSAGVATAGSILPLLIWVVVLVIMGVMNSVTFYFIAVWLMRFRPKQMK